MHCSKNYLKYLSLSDEQRNSAEGVARLVDIIKERAFIESWVIEHKALLPKEDYRFFRLMIKVLPK